MEQSEASDDHSTYDVIIAGAGLVGLTLAANLARFGVKTLLLERNRTPSPWPKMDRTNARSMEMFRRLGLADGLRALGYPADNPMDVFLMTRLAEPPLAILPFPSVAACRKAIARCHNGALPLEPYQLVSQNKVEPFLKAVAEASPNVTVRYGWDLVGLSQEEDGVCVDATSTDGSHNRYNARYLVGCDGGASTVRKALDIKLEGQGGIRDVRQVIFYSADLYDKIPYGKGRHYSFLDEGRSLIVAQGCRKEFTLHTSLPADTDFLPVLQDLIGFECDLRVLHVVPWRYNLLVAEKYREQRVFLAGDSAHLVIPTGGLGFNSGVGDAFDLAWKLAGTVKGWGGPQLLESYERERRPVALRNIQASGAAAAAVPVWQAEITSEALEDTPAGALRRHIITESFKVNHGKMHRMRGAEFGYSYAGSPIVADEAGNAAEWDIDTYTPHTRTGGRIPHMWLSDGRPLQDLLGDGYTLLDLCGGWDAEPLRQAFRDVGARLDVLRLDEPHIREVFERSVYLLRPDLHIAWRGDAAPADVTALAALVTGHAG